MHIVSWMFCIRLEVLAAEMKNEVTRAGEKQIVECNSCRAPRLIFLFGLAFYMLDFL